MEQTYVTSANAHAKTTYNGDWYLWTYDGDLIVEEDVPPTYWNYWNLKDEYDLYQRHQYRIDISDLRGKRITGAEISLNLSKWESLARRQRYHYWLCNIYDTDIPNIHTALSEDEPIDEPQPIASAEIRQVWSDPGWSDEVTLTVSSEDGLDTDLLPDTIYIEIRCYSVDSNSEYIDWDSHQSNVHFATIQPGDVNITYIEPDTPGPETNPPEVSIPTFEIVTPQDVDPDYAADLADIWISGVSKAVVSAAVESEAEITSVSFTYSGHTEPVQMTLQGGFYVATTPTAVTQGMTFTVTANAGGLTGSSDPTTLNGVQAYSAPSVNVDDIFRCNWSGERADGGECYKLKISTNVSSLQDKNYQEQNGITVLEVGILNASGNVVHLHNLSNNNNWQGPFADLDDDEAIYTIVVRINDKVGQEGETRVSINGKLLDIVMYRDTEYNKTHLGVGMKPDVSKGNGNATIQLPVGAKIIVGGTDITDWLREQIGGTW